MAFACWTNKGVFQFLGLSAVIAACLVADRADAQMPETAAAPEAENVFGYQPRLNHLAGRPARTDEEIKQYVDRLSSSDALFEVIVGQGRLLTVKDDLAAPGKPEPLIAIGDPTVVDFEVVGLRHVRVSGRRIGVTDLSIVTPDRNEYTFEIQVIADLDILRARLRQTFPDAQLQLSQIRDHIIVEGQARDSNQVSSIMQMIKAYFLSVYAGQLTKIKSSQPFDPFGRQPQAPQAPATPAPESDEEPSLDADAAPDADKPEFEARIPEPQIINLIRVPGPQQVLLKVQVAELNRTALRALGVSFLFQDGSSAFGSNIGNGLPATGGGGGGAIVDSFIRLLDPLGAGTTVFGVFNGGNFNYFVTALRQNDVLKILAEPNVVAMNGQEASFLAGGEFPIPVPQSGAATGAITIQYKEFGVLLKFIPFIQDDERIRLAVAPEVSSVDFNLGITSGGVTVPALNKRNTSTVVEMREGQTLAISGLMQVTLEGRTSRIPGLGDLAYIGPLFSNNSTQTTEKELVILVTPYLVEAMDPDQVPPRPGDEVCDPDDLEFYLLGRIEGRKCCTYRATDGWDDPLHRKHRQRLEDNYIVGPHGYSYSTYAE